MSQSEHNEHIEECKKCLEKWNRRNMGVTFPYSQCQFCKVGQEAHDSEKGTKWDKLDKQSFAYKQGLYGD